MRSMRLFVAAYPPPEHARLLAALLDRQDLPEHRPVPLDQIHLTLQFIGDRSARELDDTVESVRRAAAGIAACALAPRRLITLPEKPPTRLLAVETDAPAALLELQRRLAARLARPAKKPGAAFLPHLTVCRFRAESATFTMDQPLDEPAFLVSDIVLVESVLKPSGAEHRAVERVPLVGPGNGGVH